MALPQAMKRVSPSVRQLHPLSSGQKIAWTAEWRDCVELHNGSPRQTIRVWRVRTTWPEGRRGHLRLAETHTIERDRRDRFRPRADAIESETAKEKELCRRRPIKT